MKGAAYYKKPTDDADLEECSLCEGKGKLPKSEQYCDEQGNEVFLLASCHQCSGSGKVWHYTVTRSFTRSVEEPGAHTKLLAKGIPCVLLAWGFIMAAIFMWGSETSLIANITVTILAVIFGASIPYWLYQESHLNRVEEHTKKIDKIVPAEATRENVELLQQELV